MEGSVDGELSTCAQLEVMSNSSGCTANDCITLDNYEE